MQNKLIEEVLNTNFVWRLTHKRDIILLAQALWKQSHSSELDYDSVLSYLVGNKTHNLSLEQRSMIDLCRVKLEYAETSSAWHLIRYLHLHESGVVRSFREYVKIFWPEIEGRSETEDEAG